MEKNMKYYTSTQYKDLTADRLGEGKDWFRIKVGDYVISREHHDINKYLGTQEAQVIATDRKSVTFRDYKTGYSCTVLQEDIYRVTRKLKTKTIKAIFPSNWCDDDLRACEYRKNGDVWTLKVADLELHLKTYDFEENNDDDEITYDGEKAFKLVEGSPTTKYGSKDDRVWVEGYISKNGYCEATDENCAVSREEHHWVDACVKVISNIY
tara:strand:+ start:10492 stop:11121 length:630 start_codon:yes stop_codon:yes gene_type:complete